MNTALDIFVDLTAHEATVASDLLARWNTAEHLGGTAKRVTAVVTSSKGRDGAAALPLGWSLVESSHPADVLSACLGAAGRTRVPLLVLFGPIEVSADAIGMLQACLDRDPMFGFALPRVGCGDRCCIASLTRFGVGPGTLVSRHALGGASDMDLLTETLAPCLLVSSRVAGNFGPLDSNFEQLHAALLHYMATARRCGFRTVLSNRTVVGDDRLRCGSTAVELLPALSAWDAAQLRRHVPEIDRGWLEFRATDRERYERVYGASVHGSRATERPTLLLDIRNVGAMFNGTVFAALGIADGLRALPPTWDIELLAQPEAIAFHDLKRRFPDWPVHRVVPHHAFTATLRLSQPWHTQELLDLHGVSLFNAYLILDTIAWDIVYVAPPGLDGVWGLLADHADALFFDSEFSRQRFLERFPSAGQGTNTVIHLSFDPNEYVPAGVTGESGEPFILVVGNTLEHKDVRATVDTVAGAFPYRRLVAIGPTTTGSPLVTSLPSGALPEGEMHRLYAGAELVVFPSFYEGFGFPIVTALAHGRTVLARRSALLDEVADRCIRRGRLIGFDTREELVDLIGRLVHHELVPDLALGGALDGARPKGWRDVAQAALDSLRCLVADPSRSRWVARDHVAQHLRAPRV